MSRQGVTTLVVCLRSLSCWKTQSRSKQNFRVDCFRLSHIILTNIRENDMIPVRQVTIDMQLIEGHTFFHVKIIYERFFFQGIPFWQVQQQLFLDFFYQLLLLFDVYLSLIAYGDCRIPLRIAIQQSIAL